MAYSYTNNPLTVDPVITGYTTHDVRFPTSLDATGSDAMNDSGDYSAAFCILQTEPATHAGHGMTFTIGRGNELVVAAMPYYAAQLVGRRVSDLVADFAATWRALTRDCQVRWVGPDKGVTHLAFGAVVNALWDLWAKCVGKPVWRLVADLEPEELVRCVPFDYIVDVITPEQATALLRERRGDAMREQRERDAAVNRAVPVYTTSAGWLGYSQEKMVSLLREAQAQGIRHFKFKVGGSVAADRERLRLARDTVGYGADTRLMVDANQVWSVPQAIEYMRELADFKPWFIEEPTSPDDMLGHGKVRRALAPLGIGVATGEMCQNRVVFKQLLESGAIDVCQVDACRMGGLNEVLAVLLMAAKLAVPVVPHSGGVGLPEYTQHLSLIDYVCVSGRESLLEYVDHLHEHFKYPSQTRDGYLVTPLGPGYSVEMVPEGMARFSYPGEQGVSWWRTEEAAHIVAKSPVQTRA